MSIQTFDPQVKVVLDSISPEGIRLPTVQFRQPRMVHADFLTHRVNSRNGRSSRAVPSVTLLEEAKNPYVPHFMKNEPGMVASEEMDDVDRAEAELIWRDMAEYTRLGVARLAALKVHKQWANRPLEWFGYIDVLVSATDWNNYFGLRDESGAQPEIQQVARAIREALDASTPKLLQPGEWHLPYIEESDWQLARDFLRAGTRRVALETEVVDLLKKISAARCARLTIKPFDGDGSFEKELQRYDRLILSRPVHASPVEHQATPDRPLKKKNWSTQKAERIGWFAPKLHGNFEGWIQARKLIPHERIL